MPGGASDAKKFEFGDKSGFEQILPVLGQMGAKIDMDKFLGNVETQNFEDIRNDPMARGMGHNDLIKGLNYIRSAWDQAKTEESKEALSALYSSFAKEYNSLIDKDSTEKGSHIRSWLSDGFKREPSQLTKEAGYLDVPVTLPTDKPIYQGADTFIPTPRKRPK